MDVFYYRHNKANEKPHDVIERKISFNELTFVLRGELNYVIDGKKLKVEENACVFVSSGSYRQREKTDFCEYVSFNFYTPLAYKLPKILPNCISDEIKTLLVLCDDIMVKYNEWTDKIGSALELIVKLLQDAISHSDKNPVTITIKQYISKNLDAKLTLSEIAKHAGYSPNYCDTIFKRETGKPLIDYVVDARIEKAKLLLQEGILSLKEIADTVGFIDYNYFSRTFKKRCKISPTEYKRNTTIR